MYARIVVGLVPGRGNLERHIRLKHGGSGSCLGFMDYLSGRQTEMCSTSFPDYSLKGRTFFSKCFDTWVQEFTKEDAKQKAYRVNSHTYMNWGQNERYIDQHSALPKPYAQAIHSPGSEIIGYCGRICQDCLEIELFASTDRRKPQVISHKCKPENLSSAFSIGENEKRNRLREGQMEIPLKIRDCMLGDWTYGRIFLHSCEIPSDEEINKPNKLKLVLSNQYNWESRAINSGCTRLNYNELTDFLTQVNPNSTGIFHTAHGETHKYYAMWLANIPC